MAQTIKLTSGASTDAPTNDTLFVSANTSGAIVKHSLEQIKKTDTLAERLRRADGHVWIASNNHQGSGNPAYCGLAFPSEFASNPSTLATSTTKCAPVIWDGTKWLIIGEMRQGLTKFCTPTAKLSSANAPAVTSINAAIQDMSGRARTKAFFQDSNYAADLTDSTTALGAVKNYSITCRITNSSQSTCVYRNWWIPSAGELACILRNVKHLNAVLEAMGWPLITESTPNGRGMLSSTESSNGNLYGTFYGYNCLIGTLSRQEGQLKCTIPVTTFGINAL